MNGVKNPKIIILLEDIKIPHAVIHVVTEGISPGIVPKEEDQIRVGDTMIEDIEVEVEVVNIEVEGDIVIDMKVVVVEVEIVKIVEVEI